MTAAEWCGDAVQFVALGAFNRTLLIAEPGQLNVVGCGALLDRAVANPKIVGKIKAAGFASGGNFSVGGFSMKVLLATLALLIGSAAAFGQAAHDVVNTPTVDDCRKHAVLFQTKANVAATTYAALGDLRTEMHNCRTVDEKNVRAYVLINLTIENELRWRLERYLQRHSDTQQFLEEDEAGAR